MSEEFVRLVIGLTPPERDQHQNVDTPTRSRDRFMLFMLAWLADENGMCTVSKNALAAHMVVDPARVVECRARLVAARLLYVAIPSGVNTPPTYRLRRDVLELQQLGAGLREAGSVFVLEEFEVPRPALNALVRAGVETMPALVAEIDAYLARPDGEELTFDQHLMKSRSIRNFGPARGRQVMDGVRLWRKQRDH